MIELKLKPTEENLENDIFCLFKRYDIIKEQKYIPLQLTMDPIW